MNNSFTGKITSPWLETGFARDVYDVLDAAGGAPRFVGGCVRDAVFGREINDIDIATPLLPEAVMTALEAAGYSVIPTGLHHGTVTAVQNRETIEITTLRRDVTADGRHANIAFTDDWSIDAERRDFTMNALSCDKDGFVYDYYGGVADLTAGRLRAVGDPERRFQEDHLRILRYFRLLGTYGTGKRDHETFDAAVRLKGTLAKLSGERLTQETLKLLGLPAATRIVPMMVEAGIFDAYLPADLDLNHFSRVTAAESKLGLKADPLRRLGALLPSLSGLDVSTRLRLSAEQRDRLVTITAERPEFPVDKSPTEIRQFIYRYGAHRALDYLLIDEAKHRLADTIGCFWTITFWNRPNFPLAGQDLLDHGMTPGKSIGRALKDIEAWWISGDFGATKSECLAHLDHIKTTQPAL